MGLKVAWLSDDLAPVGKLHTSNNLWQLVVAVKAAPGLLRAFDQLEHHSERGPVREASLRADRPVSNGREGAFDRIRGAQVFPMFGREVVEGEQRVPVLFQAFGALLVFDGIGLDEGIERRLGVLPRFGHPDVLQHALGLGLLALGQLVENVSGLMHPASLLTGPRPDFADRLPEAERAISDGDLGRHRQTPALEIEQQRAPVVSALARAVDKAEQLLLALRRGADDDEDALRLALQTRLQVDAVGPDVDVALGRQVTLAPLLVFVDPDVLQPRDGRGNRSRLGSVII